MGKCELFIKIHRPIIRLACEIPKNDNLILMGNHPHKLDPVLINSIAPNVTFVRDEKMISSPVIKSIDCNLASTHMSGMSSAYIALLEKNVLCIYSKKGKIMKKDDFFKGIYDDFFGIGKIEKENEKLRNDIKNPTEGRTCNR